MVCGCGVVVVDDYPFRRVRVRNGEHRVTPIPAQLQGEGYDKLNRLASAWATSTMYLAPGFQGVRMGRRVDSDGAVWIDTTTPYHPAFIRLASEMGGMWDSARKRWSFNASDGADGDSMWRAEDAVSDMLIGVYGTNGTPTREFYRVLCRIPIDVTVWGCGRQVVGVGGSRGKNVISIYDANPKQSGKFFLETEGLLILDVPRGVAAGWSAIVGGVRFFAV